MSTELPAAPPVSRFWPWISPRVTSRGGLIFGEISVYSCGYGTNRDHTDRRQAVPRIRGHCFRRSFVELSMNSHVDSADCLHGALIIVLIVHSHGKAIECIQGL